MEIVGPDAAAPSGVGSSSGVDGDVSESSQLVLVTSALAEAAGEADVSQDTWPAALQAAR
eukprot:10069168-Lingulodinium_polyedra.AAC.1